MNSISAKDYDRRVRQATARAMRYRRAFNRLWLRRILHRFRQVAAALAKPWENSRFHFARHSHAYR